MSDASGGAGRLWRLTAEASAGATVCWEGPEGRERWYWPSGARVHRNYSGGGVSRVECGPGETPRPKDVGRLLPLFYPAGTLFDAEEPTFRVGAATVTLDFPPGLLAEAEAEAGVPLSSPFLEEIAPTPLAP